MANKRKSMNDGDVHAYKLRRSAAADLSAIKGFQGCCPDKFSRVGAHRHCLQKLSGNSDNFGYPEKNVIPNKFKNTPKSYERERFRRVFNRKIPDKNPRKRPDVQNI